MHLHNPLLFIMVYSPNSSICSKWMMYICYIYIYIIIYNHERKSARNLKASCFWFFRWPWDSQMTMPAFRTGPWINRSFSEMLGLLERNLLHSGKLTWNPNMEVWKMIFLFNSMIFRFLGPMLILGCIPLQFCKQKCGRIVLSRS